MEATCGHLFGAWCFNSSAFGHISSQGSLGARNAGALILPTRINNFSQATRPCIGISTKRGLRFWSTCCGHAVTANGGKRMWHVEDSKEPLAISHRTYNPDRGGRGANLSTYRTREPSATLHRTRAGEPRTGVGRGANLAVRAAVGRKQPQRDRRG